MLKYIENKNIFSIPFILFQNTKSNVSVCTTLLVALAAEADRGAPGDERQLQDLLGLQRHGRALRHRHALQHQHAPRSQPEGI